MRLGQTSVIYFVSKFLGSALGFVATVYFARVLGEEVMGFFALTIAVVSWLTMVGDIGFSGAIIKRVSEGTEPERYLTAGAIIEFSLVAVVVVAVLLGRSYINDYVGESVALFVALLVVTSLLWSLINSLLQGYHLVHISAPLSTAKIGVRSITGITLVLVGWGLTGMLAGYAVAWLCISLVGLAILNPRPKLPEKRHFTELIEFAKFSWLGNMRSKTYNEVDIVVLGFFVSSGLVGVYSVAWSVAKFLDVFGMAIQTTLFPEMSKRSAEDDMSLVSTLTEDALAYSGLLLLPGLVGAALLGDRLMRLYGSGFVIGDTILVLLIGGILVYTYTKQLLNTLNAIDRPDLAFRANAVFIVTNVVFNVVFIYLYGWVGAAVASALSAGISFVVAFRYSRSLVEFSIPVSEIGRQIVAAIGMGGVVYAGEWVESTYEIVQHNVVTVLVLVSLGAGAYFALLYALSSRFRRTVGDNLPFFPSIAK